MGHCCVGWWSRCIPLFHQLHSELQRSFRTSRWWQGGWWATFIPPSERRLSCWLCTIIPHARCTNWMGGCRSSQTCLPQGSQPELQSELARHDEGKTLEQFIDLAIRLDNLLRSRRQPRPSLASALTATMPPETEPMQIGFTHLSGEERERHIRQNLCLYCGRPGHICRQRQNMLIYFRFVVDACSELNLRQANCLSSIFYLKFRFDTQ